MGRWWICWWPTMPDSVLCPARQGGAFSCPDGQEPLPWGPKGASPFGIPVRGDAPLNPPDDGVFEMRYGLLFPPIKSSVMGEFQRGKASLVPRESGPTGRSPDGRSVGPAPLVRPYPHRPRLLLWPGQGTGPHRVHPIHAAPHGSGPLRQQFLAKAGPHGSGTHPAGRVTLRTPEI